MGTEEQPLELTGRQSGGYDGLDPQNLPGLSQGVLNGGRGGITLRQRSWKSTGRVGSA